MPNHKSPYDMTLDLERTHDEISSYLAAMDKYLDDEEYKEITELIDLLETPSATEDQIINRFEDLGHGTKLVMK